MPNLSQPDLNSIREIVCAHQTMQAKFSDYINQCTDPKIKKMFSQGAQDAQKNVQDLISMI